MEMSKFEELGLNKHEAVVYRTLLQLGETKTGAIVKLTNLHRVLIYDALGSLIKKGLASYVIKENIKYFKAGDPERILDFLKVKEEIAQELIPELKTIQKKSLTKQSVEIYEGLVGLKSALNNMIRELTSKDDHLVFACGDMEPALGDYYYAYQNEKKKKKILTRAIVDTPYMKRKQLIKDTYARIKYYPLGPIANDTWIYKDKVLIVTYSANPPIAVLITSQETSNSYKRIFEGYWKQAKN